MKLLLVNGNTTQAVTDRCVAEARRSAAAGTEITNTATLTSPTPTQNPDARTASVTSTVRTSADLSVTKTAQSSSPIAGGRATYLLTVTNSGPSLARNVALTDALPDDLRFVSSVNPRGTCTSTDAEISCPIGTLAAGATVVVQVVADVSRGAAAYRLLYSGVPRTPSGAGWASARPLVIGRTRPRPAATGSRASPRVASGSGRRAA